MSFAEPLALLALAALPLAVAWYLGEQRRRRAAAAAFAAPALEPSVAPRRPGWRRHLPMLAFLLALALLVLAAAKPQRTVAVPLERASIVLATDASGSMAATDAPPNRLIAAKRAVRRFLDRVPRGVNVGLVAFSDTPTVLQAPTRDRAAVRAAIDGMSPSGGTATGDAVAAAVKLSQTAAGGDGRRPPAAVVLLSDGASTRGLDPVAAARQARRLGVPVYTVAFGTARGTITVPRRGGGSETRPVPPDPRALALVASASGGRAFSASSAEGLDAVYERLGSQLGHKTEKREVTAAFAGGGLALLLTGAAMSLAWFGRLV